jgi:predicted kinase
MGSELVILIGLQGAGKSSFYRTFFAATHDLVSKDCFRNNRNPSRRQQQLLEESLGAGRPVVLDNTNPTKEDRADLILLARSFGARVVGYYFESCLVECLERNCRRQGKARVPDIALYATRKRLEPPTRAEGFDQLFFVRLRDEVRFEILDWKEGQEDDETR